MLNLKEDSCVWMLDRVLQLGKGYFHSHRLLDWIPLGLQDSSEKITWLRRLQ